MAARSARFLKAHRIAFTGLCIILCMALLCAGACSWFRSTEQVAEATKDGLYLQLTTDKHIYEQGERVTITARVENRSSEVVEWEGDVVYDYSIYVISICVAPPEHLLSTYGGACLGEDGGLYEGVLALLCTGTLNAGDSISRETFWDQTLALEAEPKLVQVPPDEYRIGATFRLEGELSVQPYDPLTTSLTVEIR